MSIYVDVTGVNRLQREIMLFIDDWARNKKTPIPQKEIILGMVEKGVKTFTTINALNSLLKKGYIRRSCEISNKTFYVQLRRV
jgi:hypothetical protein